MSSVNRDFSTISQSAKSLLLMKGHTNIPFARETAGLIEYPKEFTPDFGRKDMTFWARTLHFESRYRSIDQLLSDLPIRNILELSSGFSFRGLDVIMKKDAYYIDTDLPDVINIKRDFVQALKSGKTTRGKLELLPLNALNEEQFHGVLEHFPGGEVVILNEGLLMYLDTSEKEKLCNIIKRILQERGGYWITADVYLKKKNEETGLEFDNETKDFFYRHNVEENKFESFKEAKTFFREMGFIVDKEAGTDHSKSMSIKYLMKSASLKQLIKMRSAGKIQATWRLKIIND
jgi:O-methyltransferase involved in polyketide biosynthesis